MSLGILLLAAEFLDRKERESEHGYACAQPPPRPGNVHRRNKKQRLKKFQHHPNNINYSNRSTHNQLEKNRRAHMRNCMEQLKKVVPLGPESVKHTTQGLLIKARRLIKSLESSFALSRLEIDQLRQSQQQLRTRLGLLSMGRYRTTARSWSESSLSTTTSALSISPSYESSVPSISPSYESEQIDVVGYGSCRAGSIDADELSQVSADSGCGLSPGTRLSLDGL